MADEFLEDELDGWVLLAELDEQNRPKDYPVTDWWIAYVSAQLYKIRSGNLYAWKNYILIYQKMSGSLLPVILGNAVTPR